MKRAALTLVFALLYGSALYAEQSATQSTPDDIPALVQELASQDPADRQRAEQKLIEHGQGARPALVEAQRSDDPELRLRARDLILKLPWVKPEDSAFVQNSLKNYGNLDQEARRSAVMWLGTGNEPDVIPALMRVIKAEPAAEVRWTAVGALRQQRSRIDPTALDEADAEEGGAPLAAAMGWAVAGRDIQKSVGYFRKVIADPAAPGPVGLQEHRFILDVLVNVELAAGHYDTALDLLRHHAERAQVAPSPQGTRGDATDWLPILAIHAKYGPFDGVERDLIGHSGLLSEPQAVYCIGQIARRLHRPMAALAIDAIAPLMSGGSQAKHLAAGDFLLDQGWIGQAKLELKLVLLFQGQSASVFRTNAHTRLARIAAQEKDYLSAAKHFESASQYVNRTSGAALVLSRRGQIIPGDSKRFLEVQIHWYYFLAARQSRDEKAMGEHLDNLVALNPDSEEMTLELVPALKELHRDPQAKVIFERTYKAMKARYNSDPLTADQMNGIAWLCARCGEHLEEAEKLSQTALASEPQNPAFMDTAAEAKFRLGKTSEAIELERKAVSQMPDDAFMREQLERFRGK